MKKYSEITLNDDERKLLEVFKNLGYETIHGDGKDFMCLRDYSLSSKCMPRLSSFKWLDEDVYDIDKLLNPPHEPKTVWELEEGDDCWCLYSSGDIWLENWNYTYVEKNARSQGLVFLTREDAEFEKKRREVVARIRKYTRPFEYGFDNCFPYWDCDSHKIRTFHEEKSKSPVDYFDSWDDIQKAIDEVGEDDFKKYYLGVVDDD